MYLRQMHYTESRLLENIVYHPVLKKWENSGRCGHNFENPHLTVLAVGFLQNCRITWLSTGVLPLGRPSHLVTEN
jgi:hypothetical protein